MKSNLMKSQRRQHSLSPFWNTPLDRFFRNDFLDLWDRDDLETTPSINITEEKDSYKVDMAAPGLKKEDFNIHVDGNLLTISSEKESEKKEEEDNFTRREYNYSAFSRSITLPDFADPKGIEARYTDGILQVTIPKKPETKRTESQKIQVK
jgi:HSP20 family protein